MLRAAPVLRSEREQLLEMAEDYWRGRAVPHLPVRDSRSLDKRFDEELWDEKKLRFLWWAKLNDTAIGFAKTELIEDPVWDTQGEIGDFYIASPFRRRGHGKAFARLLLDWFNGRGVRSIRLYVRLDNPGALAFWKTAGFETVQTWHQMRRTVR
jgi:ribosomal protein S18 acetylase RimI-like enzyme